MRESINRFRFSFRSLWLSPAIRAASIFGIGGLGFAVGNVILARALSSYEYAWIALVIAFTQIAYGLGPAGADVVINRHQLSPDYSILIRVLATSAAIAIILVCIALLAYELPRSVAVWLAIFCTGIGVNHVAAAHYQSMQRFGASLLITQSHNVLVVVVAVVTIYLGFATALLPVALLAGAYAVSAAIAWWFLLRSILPASRLDKRQIPWTEGFAIVGAGTATILMIQLERLITPKLLNVESLATFAVLAAIAGSPFRVLQMGVGYTMLPRLRAARTVKERRQLILVEGLVVFGFVFLSSIFVWILTPVVVNWFLSGKYFISQYLVMAAIIAGIAKVLAAFATATITALGTGEDLARFSWLSWLSLLIAVIGCAFGSTWGLAGIIYGAVVGWLAKSIAGLALARRYLIVRQC